MVTPTNFFIMDRQHDAHVYEWQYHSSLRERLVRKAQEEAEAQAQAALELENERRDNRLQATGDEIDGFFSMAYPKAAKHAAHIIGTTKKAGDSNSQRDDDIKAVTIQLMGSYLAIWQTVYLKSKT